MGGARPGGILRLHLLIRDHPDALEADLHRFYGVDVDLTALWPHGIDVAWLLRRWRRIPRGQGAAIHSLDGEEWTTAHDIADLARRWSHVVHAKGNKDPGPHPAHPSQVARRRGPSPRRQERLAAALARKRQREADIAAGLIT